MKIFFAIRNDDFDIICSFPPITESQSTDGRSSSQSSFVTRCSPLKVTEFLSRYVETVYLKYDTGRELHFVLPFDEMCKGNFEKLFLALDQQLANLEISSYGITDTSLEEVFLTVNNSQVASDGE